MHAGLVPDGLWERVAPLLPPAPERRRRHPGRLRVPDRAAPAGILYVLWTGVAWRDVPAEMVGCSGVTAWRRLRDWTEAGVWPRLHAVLLGELRRAGLLDLDDCAVDGSHVRALKRGDHVGPSPVDRARPGSKHHVIVNRHGTPLAVTLTGGNRHDVTQLLPLLDAVPPVRGLRGRPRRKPPAAVCRPGLRLRQVSPSAVEARHQARDRPTRCAPRLRTRHGPLGGRTDLRLAPPVRTATHPLRATRRPPPEPPRPGLRPHMPTPPPTVHGRFPARRKTGADPADVGCCTGPARSPAASGPVRHPASEANAARSPMRSPTAAGQTAPVARSSVSSTRSAAVGRWRGLWRSSAGGAR